ncbi:MAG: hypothetical protein OXF79_08400 [Chloroflexi bacterium]|nr:hypothetical protein [Chloroflexota bacterium]
MSDWRDFARVLAVAAIAVVLACAPSATAQPEPPPPLPTVTPLFINALVFDYSWCVHHATYNGPSLVRRGATAGSTDDRITQALMRREITVRQLWTAYHQHCEDRPGPRMLDKHLSQAG